MSEPNFFLPAATLTAAEIARLTGARLREGDDAERCIAGIAAVDLAGPTDLAFVASAKFAAGLAALQAGVCLVNESLSAQVPKRTTALIAADPYRAFVAVAQKLFPGSLRPSSMIGGLGVAEGSFVHPTARLEPDVTIDPGAVVGPEAEIGCETVIGAGAVIGPSVKVGRNCSIGASASISHALIGDDVIIHAGCRIGQDGFGYVADRSGHRKVPQVGRVIIQDRVEIGANTTVDRGGLRDTVIGEGTKIDNLVQIGHNVSIGRHCFIVAQSGISGSVTVEDYAVLGGQVGVADHLTIGEGAQVGAKSGVMNNVPAGERWLGYPAMPRQKLLRLWAHQQSEGLRRRQARGAEESGEE